MLESLLVCSARPSLRNFASTQARSKLLERQRRSVASISHERVGDFPSHPLILPSPSPPLSDHSSSCRNLHLLADQTHRMQAASKFVDVSPELGSSFDGVVAPEDMAVYGGLCALATFSREEMKRRVLDNTSFKNFLDLVPQVRRWAR